MNKKGFTLAELIVVITILAIISAIGFISLSGYNKQARDGKRVSDIRSILTKIMVEHSLGAPYEELIIFDYNNYPKINGDQELSYIGPANFIRLMEDPEKFIDPLTGNDYPFAYAYSGSVDTIYDFVQVATINETERKAVVMGNYYKMKEGDSPSLYVDGEKVIVDGGDTLPYDEDGKTGGGSECTFDSTDEDCVTVTEDITYTGEYQTFIAPVTGQYKLQTWGAQGGHATATTGAKGGYSEGIITLNQGDTLYIYVGGQGKSKAGGWNGGGSTQGTAGYGGGGATDIRFTVGDLYSRVIVAGGAGGKGSDTCALGAVGGGLTGGGGVEQGNCKTQAGGGTQISGGAGGIYNTILGVAGTFGQGGTSIAGGSYYGGGGGGGWYGGGAGATTGRSNGGGGGSSFGWVKNTQVPGGYTVEAKYQLKDFLTIPGDAAMPASGKGATGTTTGNSGNGYAKITYMKGGSSDKKPCRPKVINGYAVPRYRHGQIDWVTRETNEYGLHQIRKQLFECNDGTFIPGEEIIVSSECNENYTYNEEAEACEPATITTSCDSSLLPSRAVWTNTNSNIRPTILTQTWNGNTWFPSINTAPRYDTNLSYTTCNYRCLNGYSGTDCNTPPGFELGEDTELIDICSLTSTVNPCVDLADDFEYTGNYQTFIAPITGVYRLETWGAQGGYRGDTSSQGGKGGYSVGQLTLTASTRLYIYVGGAGRTGPYHSSLNYGGWNGGGNREGVSGVYGGGGATDIRLTIGDLFSRLIVAGGGGSDGGTTVGTNTIGGYGGGLTGGNASTSASYATDSTNSGKGGTQTAGGGAGATSMPDIAGSFGQGGKGIKYTSSSLAYGGAGGGGWYGGSGTYPSSSTTYARGGGGGAGFVWSASTASNVPSGYNAPTSYYLTNTSVLAGNQAIPKYNGSSGTMTGNEGNGFARITILSAGNIGIECAEREINGIKLPKTDHGTVIILEKSTPAGTIPNGIKIIRQLFTCNNGNYVPGAEKEKITCDTNYELNVEEKTCIAGTRQIICTNLPANARWTNTNSSTSATVLSQTWNGTTQTWTPAINETPTYSTSSSTTVCHYNCTSGTNYYSASDGSCNTATKSVDCGGTRPANSTATSGTTYTLTWNTSTKSYNTITTPTSWTLGGETCGFICNSGYSGPSCTPSSVNTEDIDDFEYTGNYQIFIAPVTGIYRLEAWGAQGGYKTNVNYGGKGGYATGEVRLTKGTILYLYIGQSGTEAGNGRGGWNGGGGVEKNGTVSSFGGGGATDIRLTVGDLYSRLVVAGGGGSQGVGTSNGASQSTGGAGGGMTGIDATSTSYASDSTNSGKGGTQTAGGGAAATTRPQIAGSFGQGGTGTIYTTSYNNFGGAGGGGWYGGAGTYPSSSSYARGGGGGAGFVWTTSNASSVPSQYNVPTSYQLSNAYTLAGTQAMPKENGTSGTMTGKTGNGHVRITLLNQIDDGGETSGNACTQTTQNGYTIQNPPTAHGDITYGKKTEVVSNGTKETTQGYRCDNGNLIEIGNPSESITCSSGYILQDNICIPEGNPTISCTGLPSGAVWTYTNSTTQTIPQTWNSGTNSWIPATAPAATYNTAGTSSECRYRCDVDYTWYSAGQVCMATYRTQNCGGSRPTNSTPINGTTYEQTWSNGSYVNPSITTWTKGSEVCGFSCNPGWTGASCNQEADPSAGGDYGYTGNYEIFVAPKTGVYQLEVWGAQGGYRSNTTYGGKGGYAAGEITLTIGTPLYIYVGGAGNTGGANGGFNGGGSRDTNGGTSYPGGGGASDIRFTPGDLYSRVIVAGGGGSDGSSSNGGGYGGGTEGESRTDNYSGDGNYSGKGGTQTAGGGASSSYDIKGSFGQGGRGMFINDGYGGAGGGGWFGGSGTYPDTSADDDRGGGGGAGFVWTATSYSTVPSQYNVPASMYLFNPILKSGAESMPKHTGAGNMTGNTGNGAARITLLEGYDEDGVDCTATTKNGYTLPASTHGTLINGTRNQTGFSYGTKTYYQNFICNNGTFQVSGIETNSITCYANYTLKEGLCTPETRVAVCTGLPTNAMWINTNSTTAPTTNQTWAGLGFIPAVNTTGSLGYDPDPTECNYICKSGYSGQNCSVTPENENTGSGNGYTPAPTYNPSQKGTLELKYIVGYEEYGNGNLDVKFWLTTETGGYTIDWGDGATSTGDSINNQAVTHTYSEAGVKDIKIVGHIKRFYNNEDRNSLYHGKLIAITQWTNIQWTSWENMFQNAKNLLEVPKIAPDLTIVNNMNSAFTDAMAFNYYIGHWNVSNVTDMEYLFGGNSGARSFNRNISNWNTQNVSAMNGMFQNAKVFNQSIGNWDTRNVVGMAYMFSYAEAFNSPLNGWKTDNVTNMSLMFQGAKLFNQPLDNWNTSYVQRMDRMFQYAVKFNQNIAAWNTSNATNMEAMFQGASVFDQNISRWSVANVTNYTDFDQGTKASWVAGKKPNFQ